MKKLIAVTLFGLVATGCSTIHFDRTTPVSGQVTKQQWHHNFGFALYEGSAPVDAKSICGQQSWTSVKTELTFVNGLASKTSGKHQQQNRCHVKERLEIYTTAGFENN